MAELGFPADGSDAVRERGGPAAALLALACAGSFVVVMDATIVSVALPDIRADVGFAPQTLPWVVNAYTLAFAGFLLLGGRIADVVGGRRALCWGMGLFTVARVVAGLAPTPATLLAARAVQGLGGALLMPVTLALVTTTFPEGRPRARALGTWSAVAAVGAALGPVVGGLLIASAGWRWVFFVAAPVGVAVVVGAMVLLPGPAAGRERPALDVVGAVLGTAGLLGVVAGVMRSSAVGWGAGQVWLLLLAGALLLAGFVLHQGRWARAPLMPLDLFAAPSVRSGNLVMFLLGLGFFASPVLLALHMQDVLGYSPLLAGLGYLPVGVAMFAGAQIAGSLTVRLGPRRATVACGAIGTAGLALLALALVRGGSIALIAGPGMVFGFGTAAAFTPLTVAATAGVPPERAGLAAGVLNTVRQTSGAAGLAALTAVAAAVTRAATASPPAALAQGYAAAFAACAGCLLLATAVAWTTMPDLGQSAQSAQHRRRGRANRADGA